jgi:hypothetical protein
LVVGASGSLGSGSAGRASRSRGLGEGERQDELSAGGRNGPVIGGDGHGVGPTRDWRAPDEHHHGHRREGGHSEDVRGGQGVEDVGGHGEAPVVTGDRGWRWGRVPCPHRRPGPSTPVGGSLSRIAAGDRVAAA